jgi:hypothetical protein
MFFITRDFSPDAKVVTGAPYSATSTTTMTQTLANGTHIVQTQQSSLARDSAGRTRREESLQTIGPWSTSEAPKPIVFINDPVAHVQYVLEPDGQTAMKVSTATSAGSEHAMKLNAEATAKDIVVVAAGTRITSDNVQGALPPTPPPPMVAGGTSILAYQIDSDKDAKTETLPDQVIEGLTVHGKRTTSSIPAGTMGNDQPIVTSTETWYSPDLKLVVMTKRSDPRVGDTVTALTGISRAEPAATLFQVPASYTIKESDQPSMVNFTVHN